MIDFLKDFINPVFVSNEEAEFHEEKQDVFINALCVDGYLEVSDYTDDGLMVIISSKGKEQLISE